MQNFNEPSNIRDPVATGDLMETDSFNITSAIAGVTVNKNINAPSSTFEFSLHPSENWKSRISPGDWVAIYLYSTSRAFDEGENDLRYLVSFGNVDRVSRVIEKDEITDKTTLRYKISGRGFGKVFETTDLWFDPYLLQKETLDVALRTSGLLMSGTVNDHLETVLRVFLGQGADFPTIGRTSPLDQWIIPESLAVLFGIEDAAGLTDEGFPRLYGILRRQFFENMPGAKVMTAVGLDSNGSVWDLITRVSNQPINEVFLEEVRDGSGYAFPTIVVRPRPLNTTFLRNNLGNKADELISTLNGAVTIFQEFARQSYLEISQAEVMYEDLGRDDHSRLNMFMLQNKELLASYLHPSTNINPNNKGLGWPLVSRESIKRHGLRRYDTFEEFLYTRTDVKENVPLSNLMLAFLGQIYDQNFANTLYESGTIECTGVLEAELGKVLRVISQDDSPDKFFYIEGYEHQWTYPQTWRTTFTLTHGQFDTLGQSGGNPFIDSSFEDGGRPDLSFTSVYIAKTDAKRSDR